MATKSPRVSIGLPVYNGERFLEEAINSHIAQTYTDFELIISDNASTDRTEEICRDYEAKDSRLRYYRNKENIGLGPNFSRVFRLSKGEYFKWATSDDLCRPEIVERCLEVLENEPTVVLTYAKTVFIDDNGRDLQIDDPGWDLQMSSAVERMRYVIFAGHWVNCFYGLMRADALSKTRLIAGYPGGDYRLLGELSLMGKFFEIPEYLYLRRLHGRSSSQHHDDIEWMVEYHKGVRGRLCLPLWNLNLDHGSSVLHSTIGFADKLSLLGLLLRRMRWSRADLIQELKTAVKLSMGRTLA